jgi:ATP-dependent DNA helicase RecG
MNLEGLQKLISRGESEILEFKRSTGQLNRAGETLCGFLNVDGGRVLIGVTSSGKPVGQEVSDSTFRDIAQMRSKLEPPAPIGMDRVPVGGKNEVIVLEAIPSEASLPFVFDGRPYVRVGPTTRHMSQEEYQSLLLRKVHSTHRWENTVSTALAVDELDQEEVFKTVRLIFDSLKIQLFIYQ